MKEEHLLGTGIVYKRKWEEEDARESCTEGERGSSGGKRGRVRGAGGWSRAAHSGTLQSKKTWEMMEQGHAEHRRGH